MSFDPTIDSLAEKLKGWLREAEWGIEDMPLGDQVVWAFKVSGHVGDLPFAVYAMNNRSDMLVLQTEAVMAPGQIARFNKMRRERDEFLLDLQSMLHQSQTEFHFELDKYKVTIVDRIFLDGLTKDHFWRRVMALRAAAFTSLIIFYRKLGGVQPPAPAPVN